MMERQNHRRKIGPWVIGIVAWWCLLGGLARAETPPPAPARIAVIGDADSANLASLVTTELSNHPAIHLLEREELARLGDERELQQLAGRDAVALGKLAGADGLVFLNKIPAGFEVWFTAVALGYALFDDQIAVTQNLDQAARSVAHRVDGYAPKLKLDPAKAVPLSVLNLRADYDTPQSAAFERDLTLLLESRLAAVPEYVVLERRHAWSLGFEHSLDPADKPFLHGAYLIDGTVSMPAIAARNLTVTLRIRSPDSAEVITSAQGNMEDLSALVDSFLLDIKKAVGKVATIPVLTSGLEAREYLDEGLWALRAGMPGVALEAIDSAELLGANAADVVALRIEALFASVNHGMEEWYEFYDPPQEAPRFKLPKFDAATLARKTGDALRGIQEIVRFRDEKLEGQVQPAFSNLGDERFIFRVGYIQDMGIYRASKLLLLLERAKSPQADELRQALRTLTGFDPLHGHPGLRTETHLNGQISRVVFADDWSQTPKEEMAYCRLVCTDRIMDLPLNFCVRFYPREDDQKKAYDDFVRSLRDKPGCRLSYLILGTRNWRTADRAYGGLLRELWKHRRELASSNDGSPLSDNLRVLPTDVKDKNGKAAFPLLHYLFTTPHPGSGSLNFIRSLWGTNWGPDELPVSEATVLWRDLNAYGERLRPVWIARNRDVYDLDWTLSGIGGEFRNNFRDIADAPLPPPARSASTAPKRPPLVVTRFWHPWLAGEFPRQPKIPSEVHGFNVGSSEATADGLWLWGASNTVGGPQIFKITLPDFHTKVFDAPEGIKDWNRMGFMQCSSTALYLSIGDSRLGQHPEYSNELARLDLAARTWTTRELPLDFSLAFSLIGESVYLSAAVPGQDWDQRETGLTRYDWNSQQLTILASNRRRPAHNQLDDTEAYMVRGVFLGPGNQPCVTTDDGTFHIREEAGTWPLVFDGAGLDEVITTPGSTVVMNFKGEATLIDPQSPAPVPWMAAAVPFKRDGLHVEATPWSSQALWDSPPKDAANGGHLDPSLAGFHRNWFFQLVRPKLSGGYELWCYQKGQGRQPRRVSLRFALDAATKAALPWDGDDGSYGGTIYDIEHPDPDFGIRKVISAPQGLCFQGDRFGFWFLPYSDIDAYLASGQ